MDEGVEAPRGGTRAKHHTPARPATAGKQLGGMLGHKDRHLTGWLHLSGAPGLGREND